MWNSLPEDVVSAQQLSLFVNRLKCVDKVCSQRYYLLQQMRKPGLDVGCLQVVLQSIVISKVMYALPAWGGYVSRENISRIDKILHKARRYGFTSTLHCFDDKLFSGTVCTNDCLHHLLQPDRSMFPMSLRPRGHSFDFLRFKYDLTRKSSIIRSLYGQR